MDLKRLLIIPFLLVGILTFYINILNTENYLGLAFVWFCSTIIIRNKILAYFKKNKLVLFIVAEFFVIIYTLTLAAAVLLYDDNKNGILLLANAFFFLIEITYSLKEYPIKKSTMFNFF